MEAALPGALTAWQRQRREKLRSLLARAILDITPISFGQIIRYRSGASVWALAQEWVELERRATPWVQFRLEHTSEGWVQLTVQHPLSKQA